jgi:hypothetical protein
MGRAARPGATPTDRSTGPPRSAGPTSARSTGGASAPAAGARRGAAERTASARSAGADGVGLVARTAGARAGVRLDSTAGRLTLAPAAERDVAARLGAADAELTAGLRPAAPAERGITV